MTKDYSPPELPPLSEVLKSVRNSKPQNEIDYKKEYEALKQKVETLQNRIEEQEKEQLAESSVKGTGVQEIPRELDYECLILKKERGEGTIKVFKGRYENIVVCRYFEQGFYCNRIYDTCPYKKL